MYLLPNTVSVVSEVVDKDVVCRVFECSNELPFSCHMYHSCLILVMVIVLIWNTEIDVMIVCSRRTFYVYICVQYTAMEYRTCLYNRLSLSHDKQYFFMLSSHIMSTVHEWTPALPFRRIVHCLHYLIYCLIDQVELNKYAKNLSWMPPSQLIFYLMTCEYLFPLSQPSQAMHELSYCFTNNQPFVTAFQGFIIVTQRPLFCHVSLVAPTPCMYRDALC